MTTSPHSDSMELVKLLQQELANLQSSPESAAVERDAARWLYEQLATYRGMLYKRPLLRSIEFIAGGAYGTAFHSHPGWYYKGPAGADGKPMPGVAFNWYGPHASHREAQEARDKRFPRSKSQLTINTLLTNQEQYFS